MGTATMKQTSLTFGDPIEEGIPESWKASKPGDHIIGRFLRSELVDLSKDGDGEDTGADTKDKFWVHYLADVETSELTSINGSFVLDRGFSRVTAGQVVRIEYMGSTPMKIGKNPVKNYRFQVAS